MNTGIVTTILTLAACLLLGGCATSTMDARHAALPEPIVSAAEFDAMINIEVRMLEPPEDALPDREPPTRAIDSESVASL